MIQRYNVRSKYVGDKIEFEYEADDNGQIVFADGAITEIERLRGLLTDWRVCAQHLECVGGYRCGLCKRTDLELGAE